ncbi:hypothetical protein BH11BAC2_BH11BAC2_23020 [soil metagenome]
MGETPNLMWVNINLTMANVYKILVNGFFIILDYIFSY